jgi:DNA (cytosine-5)-methyltransferase 1
MLSGADGGGGRNPAGLVITPGQEPKVAAFSGGAGAAARSSGYSEKVSPTLKAGACGFRAPCLCAATGQPNAEVMEDRSPTLNRRHGQPIVCEPELARTLMARGDSSPCVDRGQNVVAVAHPAVSGTLCASGAGLSRPAGLASETDLCVVIPGTEVIPIHDRATRGSGGGPTRNDDGCGNGLGVGKNGDPSPTLSTGDRHAVGVFNRQRSDLFQGQDIASTQAARQHKDATDLVCEPATAVDFQALTKNSYTVRRLTPTECERLQGYPDGWTACGHDGKPISDSARYMMLGNSVAVPCVAYILMGIAEAIRGGEV